MPKRILVVDDDPAIRMLVARWLGKEGYEVRAVHTAEAAIEITKLKGPFDLVVTDVMMPEMDGWQLAKEFGALLPPPKVIFMSGGHEIAELEEATRNGEAVLVVKEASTFRESLIREVKNALGQK